MPFTAAGEELTLYLSAPNHLVAAAPGSLQPRGNANVTVRQGRNAALATFTSAGVPIPTLGAAEAKLFLVPGKEGMPRCADVMVSVLRVAPGGHRTVLGEATVDTTLVPRRNSPGPVVVPLTLADPGDAGPDVAVEVAIGNRCGGLRQVTLLYDAVAQPSSVRIVSGLPVTTTTSTSTTTTTIPGAAPTTTTTTLPKPPEDGCTALVDGFTVLECHFAELARIFTSTPVSAFGNEQRLEHLEARRASAAARLAMARGGRRIAANLNFVNRRLAAIRRVVGRSVGRGKIASPVGDEIMAIVGEASVELGAMRASLK